MPAKNRVFTVRIWGAFEIKFWKSAKRDRCPIADSAYDRKPLTAEHAEIARRTRRKYLVFFAFSALPQRTLRLNALQFDRITSAEADPFCRGCEPFRASRCPRFAGCWG